MENLITKCQSCRVLSAEITAPRREFLKYTLVMHWLILFVLVRVLRERDELKKALTCFKATMKQNLTLLEKPSVFICRSQTLRKGLI